MVTLPKGIVRVLRVFEDVFSERVWDWVQVLVVGAILTRGQQTVAAVLRVMGLGGERHYQNDHRVLNQAMWSSRELSRRLLLALVAALVPIASGFGQGAHDALDALWGSAERIDAVAAQRFMSASIQRALEHEREKLERVRDVARQSRERLAELTLSTGGQSNLEAAAR